MNPLAIALLKKLNIHESEMNRYIHLSITVSDDRQTTIVICNSCFNNNFQTKFQYTTFAKLTSYIAAKNKEQVEKISTETDLCVRLLICECCEEIVDLWLYRDDLRHLLKLFLRDSSILDRKYIKIGIYNYLASYSDVDKDAINILFKFANIDTSFLNLI